MGLSSGLDSLPPLFPISCVDWADCVTVRLKSSDELNECELLHPLPFANGSGEAFGENGKCDMQTTTDCKSNNFFRSL